MRHTAATVFSHRVGAVGFAAPPPSQAPQLPASKQCAPVQQVLHFVRCTYLPGDDVLQQLKSACVVLSGLDMGERTAFLGSTTTGHENKTTLAGNTWHQIGDHFTLCNLQPIALRSAQRIPSALRSATQNQPEMHNKIIRKSGENRGPLPVLKQLSLTHPLPPPHLTLPSRMPPPGNRCANSTMSCSPSLSRTPNATVMAQGKKPGKSPRGGGSAPQPGSPHPPPMLRRHTPPSPRDLEFPDEGGLHTQHQRDCDGGVVSQVPNGTQLSIGLSHEGRLGMWPGIRGGGGGRQIPSAARGNVLCLAKMDATRLATRGMCGVTGPHSKGGLICLQCAKVKLRALPGCLHAIHQLQTLRNSTIWSKRNYII